MSIWEELFCAQRCPMEELSDFSAKSEEYKRLSHDIVMATEVLETKLTGEAYDAYLHYRDLKNEDTLYLQTQAFKLGFIYGMELQKEIQDAKIVRIEKS